MEDIRNSHVVEMFHRKNETFWELNSFSSGESCAIPSGSGVIIMFAKAVCTAAFSVAEAWPKWLCFSKDG